MQRFRLLVLIRGHSQADHVLRPQFGQSLLLLVQQMLDLLLVHPQLGPMSLFGVLQLLILCSSLRPKDN